MTINRLFILLVATSILGYACSSKVAEPKPYQVVPTAHQLAWQELEYYMFIHLGPNTFTDVEWGDGKEDPKVFNPSDLDTRQWAEIAKNAGMKGIIITAKHHDGFCLWPSNYSTHTVRESKWKDGKGDVLKELSEACKEYGLKFGVYLSPWDQNHPAYGTPEYNQIFANTLNEVLTNYGEVFEQWFDGATDGTSKQVYDWKMFHDVVYKNQPQAIIFSDIGPGCRWIGNERGVAGQTNWSRLNTQGFTPGHGAPETEALNNGEPNGEFWIPGEVDVSIRPGWFYSPSTDDQVKSADKLMEIYYTSVGRNANLLLNIPPDRRGRIHPTDSTRLMEFKQARDLAFKKDLTVGATITATNIRGNADMYATKNLTDGNKLTYWATDDDVNTASIEIEFKDETTFNRILLQEPISMGQRIAAFNVEAWNSKENKWQPIVSETTIGYIRIVLTPITTTEKIKLNITNSLDAPLLSNIEIFNAPLLTSEVDRLSDRGSITNKKWMTNGMTSYNNIEGILVNKVEKNNPLIMKLDKEYNLKGITFTPDQLGKDATIQRYNLYVSQDGKTWNQVKQNEIFNNIKNNPIVQNIMFTDPMKASYVKIEPTQLTIEDATIYSFEDMDIIIE